MNGGALLDGCLVMMQDFRRPQATKCVGKVVTKFYA